ncbi:hypothetical protein ZWY2020_024835 [Hordeum vulgare]|nr:hypothetical protein ZWY2020_024835 [Hordeum vulgare]
MPATTGHDDSLSTLKDELGFSRSQSIGVKDLVQKLAELVEDDDHVTVDLATKPGVAGCDVQKDSYNGCEKDEDLADASSPQDVVVDKPVDENVGVHQSVGVVHVDVKLEGCAVGGGNGVNASVSVSVESAKPSLGQESLHAVAPSEHEDADFDFENPLENDVLVDSVAGSPVCVASNIVPDVFRVEPHVTVLSEGN